MATVLLDTSVIIDALNGKKSRSQFLRDLVEHGDMLACCPISVAEIYAGMRPKEEAPTTAFLSSLEYYPITFSVARLAGELKRDFGRKGASLSVPDTLIAAVAIHYQLPLLTDNIKDFPMKEVKLVSLPKS